MKRLGKKTIRKKRKPKNPDGNPVSNHSKVRLQTFTIIPLNQLLMKMNLTHSIINRLNTVATCIAKITPVVCLYTISQIKQLCDLAGFTEDLRSIIMNQLEPYKSAEILVRL